MAYDPSNVFARILRGEIPAAKLHEDERCLVFRDVAPQAPTHFLVIPKESIASLDEARPEHAELLGHLLLTAAKVARELGLAEGGTRVVVNNGAGAGQTVFHLHVHVLGGRPLAWPPG